MVKIGNHPVFLSYRKIENMDISTLHAWLPSTLVAKLTLKVIGVQVDHSCHGSLGCLLASSGHGYTVLCGVFFDTPMHCDTRLYSHVRQSLCDLLFYTPISNQYCDQILSDFM